MPATSIRSCDSGGRVAAQSPASRLPQVQRCALVGAGLPAIGLQSRSINRNPLILLVLFAWAIVPPALRV
ncbi:hypothetical protein QFZ86_004283 [Pseudomonas plecoglossicida]